MQGKTVVVTGATGGIGFVTARQLATEGAEIILVSRDAAKVAETVSELIDATGNPNIHGEAGDLSVQADVRAVANSILSHHPKIDVLVNNAGNMFTTRQESADGIEMTWALNHLGYFMLTNLLMPAIQSAGNARIVNVSSVVHSRGKINFADVPMNRSYGWMKAYARSKLGNVLFTYELARRYEGSGITVNCLHPGVVGTSFGHSNGIFFRTGSRIARPFFISPDKGAETSIFLASSPVVTGETGKYFVKSRPVSSAPLSHDQALQKRVWDLSHEMVGGF